MCAHNSTTVQRIPTTLLTDSFCRSGCYGRSTNQTTRSYISDYTHCCIKRKDLEAANMYRKYINESGEQCQGDEQGKMAQQKKADDNCIKVAPVEELWAKLDAATDCKSLLKKHLTKEVYEKLKDKKTSIGGTLADCINSGCLNLDSGVGVYACDPEGYQVFGALLDPVIMDYHKVKEVKHPNVDLGDKPKADGKCPIDELEDLDPKNEIIVSTRVRVGRSHAGKLFPPSASCEDRVEMEKRTVEALNTLDGDLKGTYCPLTDMSKEREQQLIDDHFLFKNDDRFLRDAGGYNYWPIGRGIFFNESKTFLTWINEEDHLRFISMQKGGDLKTVYKRLVKAITKLEEKIPFAHDDKRGYLTFCPTNLGTTCRASVHIKVPKLQASGELEDICKKHNLQPRGIHGEHTESVGGVYDISNKRRMGLTEIEAIMEMQNGIKEIIKKEKSL